MILGIQIAARKVKIDKLVFRLLRRGWQMEKVPKSRERRAAENRTQDTPKPATTAFTTMTELLFFV